MSLCLSPEAQAVPTAGERNRVLPYESIHVFKIEWPARWPDGEGSQYGNAGNLRKPRRSRHAHVGSVDRLVTPLKAVESHEAKAGDINQARIEQMCVGQNKHVIAFGLL